MTFPLLSVYTRVLTSSGFFFYGVYVYKIRVTRGHLDLNVITFSITQKAIHARDMTRIT